MKLIQSPTQPNQARKMGAVTEEREPKPQTRNGIRFASREIQPKHDLVIFYYFVIQLTFTKTVKMGYLDVTG